QTALQQRKAFTVLTPHPGEAARLLHTNTTDIQKNRLKSALELAETYQTWVVLKGAQTLIASPQKQVWLNPFGSANLAVAGTGDVLAGIIGGLLANQSKKILPLEQRMLAAVAIHGLIGEQNNWYRAGQLPSQIAQYIAKLHQET
ncbi:MAG: ADP/ATP-dependent (S)-NAD(P)H-hydrate dehydratase, partial [Ghiorsea sp.]|nr:ADP/ATP-dependent (S)-NAD(P)H-hydrate dehydratase [Ghiorsea sp.]